MDAKVQDNPDRHRFEIFVDGKLGGFANYLILDGAVVVTHSEVDPRYQGMGVGGQLAKQTLDQLRDRDARVVPSCPFFAGYVAKHHEYDDIIAER